MRLIVRSPYSHDDDANRTEKEAGMNGWTRATLLSVAVGLVALLATACGPSYPECHGDGDCAEKKQFCLNGKCNQCRDDSHCFNSLDESYICTGGSCNHIVGYCNPPAFTCPAGQKCRDKRCGPECFPETVAEDCPATYTCENGRCKAPPDCLSDADCPPGQVCKNEKCITPPVCQPREIYFDFDEAEITTSAKSALEENAKCFTERKGSTNEVKKVLVTGHCDDRGTDEYNMRLGQRRADATDKLLRKLGVEKGKIKANSKGEMDLVVPNACTEDEHARNRRAVTKYE